MNVDRVSHRFSRRTIISAAAGTAFGMALLDRGLKLRPTLAQDATSAFPPIQTVPANGAELSYIDLGQGDPVVFVHGSLNDLRSWGAQLEPFAQHYRTVAYSRRFHWPAANVADGAEYAAAQHVTDLTALLEEIDLGPVHLVGTSYGALVALGLAAKQPAMVRSLVLGEPPILTWLTEQQDGLALLDEFDTQVWTPTRDALNRGELDQGIRLFLDGALGPGSFDALPTVVQDMMRDNAPAMRLETATPFETYFSAFVGKTPRRSPSRHSW